MTIKSHRSRLNTLCTELDYHVDQTSIASSLLDEKYESCLTADSLSQIETLLKEVPISSTKRILNNLSHVA